MRDVRIAVEGCGHGTLKAIYASVEKACEAKGWDGIDLLIIGGDFQAVRNAIDLNCMAVPVKFREIGDFQLYYSGAEVAPYLTIFVGGNHEASNHLWELYYGGWVAPNIYYMGAANVLRLGSLRIAGLSGIWKGYNYRKPHYERLPYSQDDVRSIYHVREYDVRKLLQLSTQVDIGMSHDWPQGVEWLGNYNWLFKKKDLFEADAREGKLGSVAAKLVLERLRPPYWFSAHLHIKYAAVVDHNAPWPDKGPLEPHAAYPTRPAQAEPKDVERQAEARNEAEIDLDLDDEDTETPKQAAGSATISQNNDEIDLDLVDESNTAAAKNTDEIDLNIEGGTIISATDSKNVVSEELRAQLPASFLKPPEPTKGPEPPTSITNTTTNFLALDKCLPRRDFLQLLSIPVTSDDPTNNATASSFEPLRLCYDPEWLAITRVFAADLPIHPATTSVPRDAGRAHYAPLIERETAWVKEHITSQNKLLIPQNFTGTAPIHDASADLLPQSQMPREYSNPQTEAFCEMLEIPNPFKASEDEIQARMDAGPPPQEPRRGGGFGGRGGGGRGGRGGRGGGRGGGFGRGGRGRGRGRGAW